MKPKKAEVVKCLVPDCQRAGFARGLCHSHYTYTSQLVKKGKYTWEALEARGRVLPSKRVKKSMVTTWLDGGAK